VRTLLVVLALAAPTWAQDCVNCAKCPAVRVQVDFPPPPAPTVRYAIQPAFPATVVQSTTVYQLPRQRFWVPGKRVIRTVFTGCGG
jgi:hypothetical protein